MKKRKLIKKKRGKIPLSFAERAFAVEYVNNGGNGAEAYRTAVKSTGNFMSAAVVANTMLKRERVWNEINRLVNRKLKGPRITAGKILRETSRIAFFDPRDLFNEDGSLKPITEFDDDAAAVIAGFKVREDSDGVRTYDVSFVSKLEALKVLGKFKGVFRDTPGFGVNVEKGGVLVVPMPLGEVEWEKQAQQYYKQRQLVYDGEVEDEE
jgi:hypothetical protein